mgnify:CR=1 FL=1
MQKLLPQFNNWVKFLLTALIVIVPLYPKFPFIRIPGISVSIRFEDFLLLIISLFTLVKIYPKLREFLRDNLVKSIVIFLIIAFISLLSGIYITKTVDLSIGILHFVRRIEYFVPLFAILVFKDIIKNKNLEFFIKSLMLVTIISFIYGFGQKYFNFPFIVTQNEEYSKGIALYYSPGSHINSTFAGHYDLATFLVLLLPIFISSLFLFKEKLTRIFLLITIFGGLWLLGASASRISVVSYILAASISLIFLKKYKEILLVGMSGLILLMSSGNLYDRYERLIDVLIGVKAAEEVEVFEDRSTSIRLAVEWPRAIRSLTKNPILGTGYSSMGLATDNDYLRLLGELGILGFLAFGLIFINLYKIFKQSILKLNNYDILERSLIVGVIGGTLGVLINAIFIDVFEASKFVLIFWFVIGITVITVRNNINVQKS